MPLVDLSMVDVSGQGQDVAYYADGERVAAKRRRAGAIVLCAGVLAGTFAGADEHLALPGGQPLTAVPGGHGATFEVALPA